MKTRFPASFAIPSLLLVGVFCLGAQAQTTQEGPGPSEQPSAPMEIGQIHPVQTAGNHAPPIGEADPNGPSGEKPAQTDRGVARISLIHGDVSTQRGDSGDWSAAVRNQPVVAGDKVSTGDGARVEVQLDYADLLRLGPNSKANIAGLTHKNIQIQLAQGMANYTVFKEGQAEPEIDTPNVAVHPAHEDGVFRIELHADGDTIIIVRKGEAQISTPQGTAELKAGDMATVRGVNDDVQYKISAAPDRDDWDQWNSDRDHMVRDAKSWGHTNRYYTGSEDLDAYGTWRNVPDYGDVWVPNEQADWVPYRNGNWVYEPYWGWTWVGYEPWGWAPYHYGRWFWYGSSWAWWPGPVGYEPFWAPAYVSFWGWGGGWGFGFGWGGWGGFGWFPIGPCDRFFPWWGGYRGRFGTVGRFGEGRFGGIAPLHGGTRFSNVARINDPHIGRALSTVDAGHFGAGHLHATAATAQQLQGGHMMAGNLPVMPSHASLSASGRAPAPGTMREGAQHFYGTSNNLAHPASFQQETSHLQQSMQQGHVSAWTAGERAGEGSGARATAGGASERPSAGSSRAEAGSSRPSSPNAGASRPGSAAADRGGFRPFTPPSGNASSRGEGGAASERGGSGTYWNRTTPGGTRPGGYGDGYGRSASRPQLDMRQNIVQPRSSNPYGGAGRGGYGVPGYPGSRGPSSGPGYGGGGRSGGGGGYGSHPSGGGGGGGGHSGGGGGGGGHSGGGGSGGGHR